MDLHEMFEKHDDEYLKFDRIENKRSTRPDLHAFLLLNELFPRDRDIIAAAEHDIIYLDIDCEEAIFSESVVIELSRCGVMYEEETDSLAMFV